jgi:hypothetical protein
MLSFCYCHWTVGAAHINSGAGQSQFRSHPMLNNGWISTFPHQRSHPHSASTVHVSIEVVRQTRSNRTIGQAVYYSVRTQLLKADWYVYRSNNNTQRWRHTQSEPSKRETFFNQQPANLQAEVRSYVPYKYNKYSYKRWIRGCLYTHRQ